MLPLQLDFKRPGRIYENHDYHQVTFDPQFWPWLMPGFTNVSLIPNKSASSPSSQVIRKRTALLWPDCHDNMITVHLSRCRSQLNNSKLVEKNSPFKTMMATSRSAPLDSWTFTHFFHPFAKNLPQGSLDWLPNPFYAAAAAQREKHFFVQSMFHCSHWNTDP